MGRIAACRTAGEPLARHATSLFFRRRPASNQEKQRRQVDGAVVADARRAAPASCAVCNGAFRDRPRCWGGSATADVLRSLRGVGRLTLLCL